MLRQSARCTRPARDVANYVSTGRLCQILATLLTSARIQPTISTPGKLPKIQEIQMSRLSVALCTAVLALLAVTSVQAQMGMPSPAPELKNLAFMEIGRAHV